MAVGGNIILLPDAGPLITLAYADALNLLLDSAWELQIADMAEEIEQRAMQAGRNFSALHLPLGKII